MNETVSQQKPLAVFLKYVVVGVVGTAIDVGGFTLLIAYTALPRFVAATISFAAAVINNYSWNKVWTFQDTSHTVREQFPKFLFVSLIGLALNLFFLWLIALILTVILPILGLIPASSALPTWGQTLAKLGASACVLAYNFVANKYWTFR